MSPKCDSARTLIETRDFGGWHGLPERCQPADLFPQLAKPRDNLQKRLLGDEYVSARFALLTLAGYYRPMASFDGDELLMMDAGLPDLHGDLTALLADLGEPDARLDWSYGTLPIARGEWVFARRGITLFLDTQAGRVLHIALYQRTTLDNWRRRLRPDLQKVPKRIKR